jgi:hypothetical protein
LDSSSTISFTTNPFSKLKIPATFSRRKNLGFVSFKSLTI